MSQQAGRRSTIQGELQRQGLVVTGWCWSPDEPGRRLAVELTVDGRMVAAAVAARLRLDLVRDGVCDGYHGFTFALPAGLTPSQMLETRERSTGIVFGRVLGGEQPELRDWTARSQSLSAAVADLQRRVSRSAGTSPARVLSLPWTHLKPRRAAPSSLATRLRLPHHDTPAASLLLSAAGAGETCLAAIAALAPLLSSTGAEIVAADDGRGAASARLATLPGLRQAHSLGGESDSLNAAARAARAPVLVFLDPAGVGAPGVSALLRQNAVSRNVVAGAELVATARSAGLDQLGTFVAGPPVTTGLWLLLPKDRFHALGGFDAAFEDGAGLPMLDLALRLLQAGDTIQQWRDLPRMARTPSLQAGRARALFAARWAHPWG